MTAVALVSCLNPSFILSSSFLFMNMRKWCSGRPLLGAPSEHSQVNVTKTFQTWSKADWTRRPTTDWRPTEAIFTTGDTGSGWISCRAASWGLVRQWNNISCKANHASSQWLIPNWDILVHCCLKTQIGFYADDKSCLSSTYLLYIPLVAPPTAHLTYSVSQADGAVCSLHHTGSGL